MINHKVKIKIHRGIDQIGGCITEISSKNTKILIDFGHNLPDKYENVDNLANEKAVNSIVKGCDAILYTHFHGDHVGLFHLVPDNIPQYIGCGAQEVMACLYRHLKDNIKLDKIRRCFKNYYPGQRLYFGDIVVTPFFSSHSAFDSYMFLVETNGFQILHTGDFRSHGFLGKTVDKIIDKVKFVDVLITEGTMLGRKDENVKVENEIESDAINLMRKYKNVFVMCSSTDMERQAAFYAANRKMIRRPYVCDNYQKEILDIFTKRSGKYTPLFDFGNAIPFSLGNHKLLEWMHQRGFTMPLRVSMGNFIDVLLEHFGQDDTLLIYSMWNGYYIDNTKSYFSEKINDIRNKFKNCIDLHTSGHADIQTLANVCSSLAPKLAIVPIHREKDSDFSSIGITDELKSRIVTKTKIIGDLYIEA